jgi:type IV pilus assembly protein PilC
MNKVQAYLRAPRQNLRDEAFMLQRLAFLMRAGMPIAASLKLISLQSDASIREALTAIQTDVEGGKLLAESLSAFPHLTHTTTREVIRIGELSGKLAENLSQLASDLRRKASLNGKLAGALIYPAFISIAALSLTIGLVLFIFPKIIPLFSALGADLPFTTRAVLAVYDYLSKWGVLTAILMISASVAWARLIRRHVFLRRKMEKTLLSMPIFGPFIRAYHLSNLTRTLALLLESGMTLRNALPAAARVTPHLLYREEFERLAGAVEHGSGIAAHLRNHPSLFPDLVAQMIHVGESSGTLAETLASLSAFYEEEVDERMKSISSLVEPALMICMGLLVGWIAVSMVAPMYAITQHLHAR